MQAYNDAGNETVTKDHEVDFTKEILTARIITTTM